jgi:hypothetical protein
VTPQVVPKATCDSEKCLKAAYQTYTRENFPMTAKESQKESLMWLSEQSLELVTVIYRSKQTLLFYFSRGSMKI